MHWEVLPPNQTINAAFYCLQLDIIRVAKRLYVINQYSVILHHDNVRPHAAVITCQKVLKFDWDVLYNSSYSSHLALTDYQLFEKLNCLQITSNKG